MAGLAELQSQMRLVSLEECSVWDKVTFPEKRKAVENRVRSTCEKILERHKDENILFVGHGLSIHYVVRLCQPASPSEDIVILSLWEPGLSVLTNS